MSEARAGRRYQRGQKGWARRCSQAPRPHRADSRGRRPLAPLAVVRPAATATRCSPRLGGEVAPRGFPTLRTDPRGPPHPPPTWQRLAQQGLCFALNLNLLGAPTARRSDQLCYTEPAERTGNGSAKPQQVAPQTHPRGHGDTLPLGLLPGPRASPQWALPIAP